MRQELHDYRKRAAMTEQEAEIERLRTCNKTLKKIVNEYRARTREVSRTAAQTTQEKFEAHDPFIKMYEQHIASAQTPAHLEELAQWADAAVELFPVHGEKFRQIAEVLRRLPPAD
jgi:hypothetical protein